LLELNIGICPEAAEQLLDQPATSRTATPRELLAALQHITFSSAQKNKWKQWHRGKNSVRLMNRHKQQTSAAQLHSSTVRQTPAIKQAP
jgi:hypothetical protein